MKRSEKEIRGRFESRKEMYEMLARIGIIASGRSNSKRLSVLFTTGNDKGVDLQIRLHNLDGEIILKRGRHEGNLREENVIKITHDQFIPSIFFAYNLGFKKGVVANCRDWVFNINDEEIKLTECDNKIFCWEIETKNDKTPVIKLKRLAKTLGIMPLNEAELIKYWAWMKRYGNKRFQIGNIEKIFKSYLKNYNEIKK